MENTYMTMTAAASTSATCLPVARHMTLPQHYIETANVVLRAVTADDLDNYAELLADAQVMRFVGLEEGQVLTREETAKVLELAVNAWSARGYGRWSAFDRETGEFIGFCGYRCEEGKPELISIVHKRCWGTGLSYEIADACLEYGFNNLGFEEVVSFCRPTNLRAKGLLRKLGAEFVGIVDFHGVEGAAYRLLPTLG